MKEYRPSDFEIKVASALFTGGERRKFYEEMISLMEAGLTIDEAVKSSWMAASEEGKKPKETTAIVLNEVIRAKMDGASFADALAPFVPVDDAMVISAIEKSNDFAANLRDYLIMLEKKQKIRSTIMVGSLFPLMLFAAVIGIMNYFGKEVVPVIDAVMPMEQWMGPTRFLVFVNTFATSYVTPVIVITLVTLLAIFISLPRWKGGGRIIADKFPIYSTYRMYTGISFLMAMASLIQGGMQSSEALEKLRPRANPYVAYRLLKVRNQMLNGTSLGAALHKTGTNWPDRKMNLSIKIFSQTNDLEKQLSVLAVKWVDQAQKNVTSSMAILRFVSMIAVAGTLMGIISGVFALQGQITSIAY